MNKEVATHSVSEERHVLALRGKLWSQGYRPVAVHGPDAPVSSPGKQPVGKGWQDRARFSPPEAAIALPQMGALNTGILCDGLRVVDIDVDIHDLAQEITALAIATLGPAPIRYRANGTRTLMVYRATEGEPAKRMIKTDNGSVEILGRGQQFVAFGKHVSRSPYLWEPSNFVEHNISELNSVSEAMIDEFLNRAAKMLGAYVGDRKSVNPSLVDADCKAPRRGSPEADHASQCLHEIVLRLSAMSAGAGRNQALNDAARRMGEMVGAGWISVEQVEEALLSAGESNGYVLQDGHAQTLATIRSGLSFGIKTPRLPLIDVNKISCKGVPLSQPSNGVMNATLKNAEQLGATNLDRPWKSLSDLQHKEFAPVSWIIPGHVPQGLTVLAGRPKLGKSWLALDWCLAVATGGSTFGVTCEEGDVLYAALEDTERRLKSRAQLVAQGSWPSRLSYLHEMPRADDGGLDLARKWLEEATVPRLIVIDVLAKVRSGKGRDEGSYDADYRAVSLWKSLADEFQVGIILIHHVRKLSAEDTLEMVSGTNGLTGAADTILILNRNAQGCTLNGRGRDLEEFDKAIKFDRVVCKWQILGEVPDVRRSSERTAILEAFEDQTTLSPSDIAAACGQVSGNVRFLLHKMVDDGELEKAGRGRYRLPSANIANTANTVSFE